MSIRDEELSRLVKYCQGLGTNVKFKPRNGCGDEAAITLDNSEITVYTTTNTTKTEKLLSLIHEVGHLLCSIHEKDRDMDEKLDKAIDHINEAEERGEIPNKEIRKIFLDDEIRGTKYWEQIYKETNLKFPKWRLFAAMEIDVQMYRVYYEEGKYPIGKRKKDIRKKIENKYRGKNA